MEIMPFHNCAFAHPSLRHMYIFLFFFFLFCLTTIGHPLVLRITIIGGKNNPRVKRWARGMEPHSGDHAVSQLCFRTPIGNLARVWASAREKKR